MNVRDWIDEFEAIEAGQKAPQSFAPKDLFDMARALSIRGNFAGAANVRDWIFQHPEAIAEDQKRVLIARADGVRRAGDGQKALDMLLGIKPNSLIGLVELLQVNSEAMLLIGMHFEVLVTKRMLMVIAVNCFQEFTPDQQLFYHYGLIQTMFVVGTNLELIQAEIEAYRDQVTGEPDPDKRDYHWAAYNDMMGQLRKRRGDMEGAAESYSAYFDHARSSAVKAFAALEYLKVVWHVDESDRRPRVTEVLAHYQLHKPEIQPAWLSACQDEYAFVERVIAGMTHS